MSMNSSAEYSKICLFSFSNMSRAPLSEEAPLSETGLRAAQQLKRMHIVCVHRPNEAPEPLQRLLALEDTYLTFVSVLSSHAREKLESSMPSETEDARHVMQYLGEYIDYDRCKMMPAMTNSEFATIMQRLPSALCVSTSNITEASAPDKVKDLEIVLALKASLETYAEEHAPNKDIDEQILAKGHNVCDDAEEEDLDTETDEQILTKGHNVCDDAEEQNLNTEAEGTILGKRKNRCDDAEEKNTGKKPVLLD